MAKNILPTDYKDDLISESMNGKRRYRLINNPDGTISLEDVTEYEQLGSIYGAKQINSTNQAVNESFDKNKIVRDMDTIQAMTQEGYVPDALALKALNESLGGLGLNATLLGQFTLSKSDVIVGSISDSLDNYKLILALIVRSNDNTVICSNLVPNSEILYVLSGDIHYLCGYLNVGDGQIASFSVGKENGNVGGMTQNTTMNKLLIYGLK